MAVVLTVHHLNRRVVYLVLGSQVALLAQGNQVVFLVPGNLEFQSLALLVQESLGFQSLASHHRVEMEKTD